MPALASTIAPQAQPTLSATMFPLLFNLHSSSRQSAVAALITMSRLARPYGSNRDCDQLRQR